MWRVVVILGLVALMLAFGPARRSTAHYWACYERAYDNRSTFFPGINYTWFAANACTENMEATKATGHIQYYDWTNEEWKDDPDVADTHAIESDDDAIIVFGALNVPPYLGINCRRVRVYFDWVDKDFDVRDSTKYSNGECY